MKVFSEFSLTILLCYYTFDYTFYATSPYLVEDESFFRILPNRDLETTRKKTYTISVLKE